MESLASLARNKVALVSITENIDYSTDQGKLMTIMLAGFAEYFSNSLGTHIKKGISERALQGRHLGGIPFGYSRCWEGSKGDRHQSCDPEHPGGVHPVPKEAEAVRELFRRYAAGNTTLSQLAVWMNSQGFRTRNMRRLPSGNDSQAAGPKLFTTASVRVILHNPFYMGKIKHRDQLLPGSHQALVSDGLFQQAQSAMKRNSGRSQSLHPGPEREYLLKGLVKCAHCGMALWAQTLKRGSCLYREQKGSRGDGYCVNRSRSMTFQVPDEQISRIIEAILLPETWVDLVLAQIHLADEVERVKHERIQAEHQLRQLGRANVDGLSLDDDYRREKRGLEEKLAALVVPEVDATREAGMLLDDLPELWEEADLVERRKILITMLEAVYVDTVEQRAIVVLKPKPAFQPLFQIATTKEGSGVVLYKENLPDLFTSTEDDSPCSCWRRVRVKLYLTPYLGNPGSAREVVGVELLAA